MPKPDERGDNVSSPSHYVREGLHGLEVIDFIRAFELNFNRGSAVKYIMRAGSKNNELEDLRKARKQLDAEIEWLEDRQ